jgi:SAM-dependent methyltransferase
MFGQPSPRVSYVHARISKDLLGLEIGPSHSPLAPKRDGFNVRILDHADADTLRRKYAVYGANISNIEEVDFVWAGEPINQLIGSDHGFDWIVGSHVVEHVPDFIGFLQQCESILSPTGRAVFVIPDKRYCSDVFQSLTSSAAVIDARDAERNRATAGTLFDYYANHCSIGRIGDNAWQKRSVGRKRLTHPELESDQMYLASRSATDYIDIHNWCFTPASFELIVGDCHRLGAIELSLDGPPRPGNGEFYVCLSFKNSYSSPARIDQLRSIAAGN